MDTAVFSVVPVSGTFARGRASRGLRNSWLRDNMIFNRLAAQRGWA